MDNPDRRWRVFGKDVQPTNINMPLAPNRIVHMLSYDAALSINVFRNEKIETKKGSHV